MVNKAILIGRLGRDPELRHTQSGQSVANFSIAISEKWTDKSGQKNERTEWVSITIWGKMAEVCQQYLSKGSQVFVEGKIRTEEYQGKDGSKKFKTYVLADNVRFLGGGRQGGGEQGQQGSAGGGEFTEDDIPF